VIQDSDSTKIINNTLKNNKWAGIGVGNWMAEYQGSDSLLIANNTISQNYGSGIHLESSTNSSIIWNLIADNDMGLELGDASNNTKVHHNSFINNARQAWSSRHGPGENWWYDQISQEGNYWSDYEGTGSYTIEGEGEQDLYPLSEPLHSYTPPFPPNDLVLILIVLLNVGILIGVIAGVSIQLKQLRDNQQEVLEIYKPVLQIGFLLLIIQNLWANFLGGYVFFSLLSFVNPILQIPYDLVRSYHRNYNLYFSFICFLDLLAFFLLVVGYLLYSTRQVEKPVFYRCGAISILGWIICRVLIQFIIPLGVLPLNAEVTDFTTFITNFIPSGSQGVPSPNPVPSGSLALIFLIGAVLLGIGVGLIWWVQKRERTEQLLLIFGFLNLLAVLLLIPFDAIQLGLDDYNRWTGGRMMGMALKGLIVPILGMVAGYSIWQKVHISNKYWKKFKSKWFSILRAGHNDQIITTDSKDNHLLKEGD
jgi:parallel beta-helix repeat protein